MGPKKSHRSEGYMVHLVCPHCSKEFNGNSSSSGVQSNYRRHLLIHTKERPYTCPYCNTGFTTKPNMRRHIEALHTMQQTPPNKAQTAANGVQPAGPVPPLELPSTTSSASSPAASFASSKAAHSTAGASTVETKGLTSSATSTAPAALEVASEDARQPPRPPHPTTATFICEDCELEVSSKAKLRRHQRYYCPFRDNIFVDPVQDILCCYRAAQEEEQQPDSQEDEESSAWNSDVFFMDNRGTNRGKKSTSVLALTKEEKDYLTRVAAESGLKFVEDAYASEGGSDDMDAGEESYSCSSASNIAGYDDDAHERPPPRCSRDNTDRDSTTGRVPGSNNGPSSFVGSVSAKHTPLHGPFPSPNKGILHSPPFSLAPAGRGERQWTVKKDRDNHGEDDEDDEDGESGVNPGEDLLHLHFHRRGSGHKRERRILQKRLRAQEGAMLGLIDSPPHRPQTRDRLNPIRDAVRRATQTDCGAHGSTTSSEFEQLPPDKQPQQRQRQQSNPVSIVVSEQLLARADSLLTLNWRQEHRNKTNVSSAFICPYCDDFSAFVNQRQLTQHMRRMHPVEAARNAARAAATEPVNPGDFSLPPP